VHDGTQYGISLEVTPAGARALFGMPASELGGTVVPLDALLGRAAERLVDQLRSAPSWSERFALLDATLLRAASARVPTPRPEVVRVWERLVATGGRAEVGSLALEVGWSRRHLADRFRAEFGLAPKVAARVLRFERSRRLLARPERPGLATVSADAGYFDQSHMHREWRALAGCTPSTWIAEELPSVQDGEAGGGGR
jgi:AraC-like DNA-binding protein